MIFLSKGLLDSRFNSNMIENPNYLDIGSEGCIFKVGEDRVAKIFHSPLRICKQNIDDLLAFRDINIKNIIFADEIIYYPFKIGGVLMPYAPGVKLSRCFLSDYDINILIEALDEIAHALDELSSYDIGVDYDVHERNTIFDGHSFYLVDTFGYERNVPSPVDKRVYNRNEVLGMLYNKILNIYSIYEYFQNMHGFKWLSESGLLLGDQKEVLSELKEHLEAFLGEPFNTFREAAVMLERRR